MTVVGKVMDVDYDRLLTRDKTLSLLDIEMLSRIQMHRPLSKEEIDYLRKSKLVEGRKNALYFVNSVAGATGQKVEYSMHKGLEYKGCKALLLDTLRDHKSHTREEIDKLWWKLLSDVLTEKQKKDKNRKYAYKDEE